jgi:hypothetical protein
MWQPIESSSASLAGGFHPFGHHAQAQPTRHGQDGIDDARVVRIVLDVLHEGAVDLDGAHGKRLELGQRGVAGAEVVDGQLHCPVP